MAGKEQAPPRFVVDMAGRYRRVSTWFFLFVAFIPLGVIGPCGVAMVVYQFAPKAAQPIALSALLLPIAGVAGMLLLRGDRSRLRRSLALAQLAEELGLEYTYKPVRDQFAFLNSFSLMSDPTTQMARDMLEGTFKKRPLTALDYTFSYDYGSVSLVGAQTVVVFEQGFAQLPEFVVLPLTWGEKLEEAILGKAAIGAITVPGEKEFNRSFSVMGSDRRDVLACLTPEVIDLFLRDKGLTAEIHDGMLLVCRRQTFIRAEDYEDFLLRAHRLAKELELGIRG